MSEIGTVQAVILGIVEGLTEFIPVSSTGHLILVGSLLGEEGEKAKVFEVCIQFGAILAVGLLYFKRLFGLLNPNLKQGFQGFYGAVCLVLGCLPAVILGALFSSKIKSYLFYPLPVGLALIAGAILMIWVEKRNKQPTINSLDELRPKDCFLIGLFQSLSLWPGMSRAATSMVGGIFLGVHRKVAAEFSFLMAVPLIAAATLYDVYKNWQLFSASDIVPFAIGSIVAFISAWFAVKGFIAVLSRVSLLPFAYYRLLVGVVVVWVYSG